MSNEIPLHLQEYMKAVERKRDEARTAKLLQSLKILGFTFPRARHEAKFINQRLKIVNALDSPGIEHVYLDYGKKTQALLAIYNNKPEISDVGDIMYRDRYYENKPLDFSLN